MTDTTPTPAKRLFIVYDGRARDGTDTDDAAVLVACGSLDQARSYRRTFRGGHIWSYAIDESTKPPSLEDERYEERL